jgi:phosphonopyruvate decarboxylase
MIPANSFIRAAQQRGFCLYSGVPCSYLKPLINHVIDSRELRYVGAANEGEAVAIAAGAELGGQRSVAIFQNSGLGNAVNPLTSLTYISRIPILLIPTLRGEPGGPKDEPQHQLMGAITTRLLDLMQIPWEYFPSEPSHIASALDRAVEHMRTARTPYALVMKHGSVEESPLRSRPEVRPPNPGSLVPAEGVPQHTRHEMLRAVQMAVRPSDAVLATTGYTGRELYACDDRDHQFYLVGAMGCASSVALGLALAQPRRRVVVLDGDGALIMRLGALTTIGYERPTNLLHIVLDNQAHESTGGQSTVSHSVDFCAIAAACGYSNLTRAQTPDELAELVRRHDSALTFAHVPIKPGTPDKLPRPAIGPAEVAERLRAFLRRTTA